MGVIRGGEEREGGQGVSSWNSRRAQDTHTNSRSHAILSLPLCDFELDSPRLYSRLTLGPARVSSSCGAAARELLRG